MKKTYGYSIQRCAVALALLGGLTAMTLAQGPPCLTYPKGGPEIRQFSRNISGRMIPGKSTIVPTASTTVINMNCQPVTGVPGLKSRRVNYGQLVIDFSTPTDCDELKGLKGTLVGDYFSLTRLSDPFGPTAAPDNTRVGRHNANGNVLDASTPPNVIGTFTMRGTIGSNTQRATSLFGVGPCYWCQHHEGLITIKLKQSPMFVASGNITATYSWDVNAESPDCKSDPCLIQQFFNQGTMDGIAEAPCGTIKM